MANPQDHPLLKRPLYVFDLPAELLYSLQLRADVNVANQDDPSSENGESTANGQPKGEPSEGEIASAMSCALCGLSFTSIQDQRAHVRSDLHGYNLKQKLRGLKPVEEKEFDRLVGELDESISDSESSYSGSDEEDEGNDAKKQTTLSALLKKQGNITEDVNDDFTPSKRKRGAGKPPLLWFSSSKLPSNFSLGVYRAIFPLEEQVADGTTLVQSLQRKQLAPSTSKPQPQNEEDDSGGVKLPASMRQPSVKGPLYFLCMIGGGHFAAMIISLTPSVTRKGGVEDRSATVVAHKTFHRYTTRRKQGGAQSANDNSKGNAHSAGAGLRRYNEAALTTDVRNLLSEWKHMIQAAELLFIRATGTTNRRTLYDKYEGQVLSSQDPRIRGFPFSTRRATQAELMRCFVELTRVKTSTIDELALAQKAAEDAARAEQEALAAKAPPTPKPSKPKASKEEEEALLHTSQLQSLIRRSKAPALVSYITSNSLSPNFEFLPKDKPENHHAPTPLHLATSLNSPACVSALLLKASADPTIRNPDGKSAHDLAGDRATRDAFRIARSTLGEGAFAWDEAGVGSALTKGEADARAAQERAEGDAEKEAEKTRRQGELERLRKEEKEREESGREKKFGKGKSLMAEKVMTAEERREEESRGMTPEMRMKLERERRARAAEARFAKK
ncbi:VMS1-like protein [Elsinoe australis]|uniref:VMS1-like protein n=1 Tax=Elsinoe australis TaxID=40998 RepID=A0A4U7AW66_9PEZI|nr:VMS1-like protein [Elsinoe australis]